MNVAVDDRLRRQGIADVLMDRLFALADAPGVQYTLEVRTSNGPAIRLYEKLGFAAAGRRRGYYHDNREDAVIMWRTAPDLPAGDRPWDVGDSSLDAGDGPRAPGDGRSERVASRRQARGGSQRPDRA
ncbi:MAG: GNAT family N-acetyltransferase [Thermoleophilaceae bacterium]